MRAIEQLGEIVLQISDAFLDHLRVFVGAVPQCEGLGAWELWKGICGLLFEHLFMQLFECFKAEGKRGCEEEGCI